MIDTTVGVESVTWYATDMRDPRRITVTFQDALRSEHMGGEKLPAELELWGDSKVVPYSSMLVESPDKLDELAKAIEVAAQHWRHCIEECDCFTEDGHQAEHHHQEEDGVKIISFGGVDIPGLWIPDEEEEPEDPDDDNGYPPVG